MIGKTLALLCICCIGVADVNGQDKRNSNELISLKARREVLQRELDEISKRIAQLEGKNTSLPAPADFLSFDSKWLERDDLFSVEKVVYGQVGEGDIRGDGVQWKLKAKKEMAANDAKVTLGRFSYPGLKFMTADNEQVGTGRLSLPNKVEFGFVTRARFERGEVISVWMFLNRQAARDLAADGAVRLVPVRP